MHLCDSNSAMAFKARMPWRQDTSSGDALKVNRDLKFFLNENDSKIIYHNFGTASGKNSTLFYSIGTLAYAFLLLLKIY